MTTTAATWLYLISQSVGNYLGFIRRGLALTAGLHDGHAACVLAGGRTDLRALRHRLGRGQQAAIGSRGWVVLALLQGVSIDRGWNSPADHLFRQEVRGAASGVALARDLGRRVAWRLFWFRCLRCSRAPSFSRRCGAAPQASRMVTNILFAHVFVGLWMLHVLNNCRIAGRSSAQRTALASPDRLWERGPPASSSASARHFILR